MEEDLLQKYISYNGLINTIKTYLYNPNFINIPKFRKRLLCELALLDLKYELNKIEENIIEKIDFEKILKGLLYLSKNDYSILKNHDYMLKLCLENEKINLADFILKTRNYFDSILMLLLGVNNEINKQIINLPLVVKYLGKLKDYSIEYIPEIKDKVTPYIYSRLLLHPELR